MHLLARPQKWYRAQCVIVYFERESQASLWPVAAAVSLRPYSLLSIPVPVQGGGAISSFALPVDYVYHKTMKS